MKTAVFSAKLYDRKFLNAANSVGQHDLEFFETRLTPATARLAAGFEAVCPFVNDVVDAEVLTQLAAGGTRLIALRSAGFNHVDLREAESLGLTVVRVPAYSPHAVAEHTIGLILTLNRKIHRAYNRVREGNFSLEGLLGFDLNGTTAGIIGTGKIGMIVARLLAAFGCRVLAYDLFPNPSALPKGAEYADLKTVLDQSDIVSLHCPLTPETHHLINETSIEKMKKEVMLINTSRGGLIDTNGLIAGLKSGQIGSVGLDVYEEEGDLFFEDLSQTIIQDDRFMRLLSFPNVLITGHQAFFTREAVRSIAEITLSNISAFENGRKENEVIADKVIKS